MEYWKSGPINLAWIWTETVFFFFQRIFFVKLYIQTIYKWRVEPSQVVITFDRMWMAMLTMKCLCMKIVCISHRFSDWMLFTPNDRCSKNNFNHLKFMFCWNLFFMFAFNTHVALGIMVHIFNSVSFFFGKIHGWHTTINVQNKVLIKVNNARFAHWT